MLPGTDGGHRAAPIPGGMSHSLNVPFPSCLPHASTGSAAGLKELSAAFEALCFFFLPHLPKALLEGGWGLRQGPEIRDYGSNLSAVLPSLQA